MKKLFILCLLIVFAVSGVVYAATKAKTASMDKGILTIAGIADLSSGDTAEVNSDGSLQVNDVTAATDSLIRLGTDTAVLSGAGVLKRVIFTSGAADDYVEIYDNTSATGTPVVDIIVHTANDTKVFDLDIDMATGIYADFTISGEPPTATIVYLSD